MARVDRMAGDLLLRFGKSRLPSVCRSRSSVWRQFSEGAEISFLESSASDFWRGFPLQEWKGEEWHELLIGEFYGVTRSLVDNRPIGRYLLTNPASSTNLSGHFALIGWDESSRQAHIWTDRFGSIHLYHARGEAGSAIGTFFPAISEFIDKKMLNWQALTSFFSLGFFPEDTTYLQGVKVLSPATHYALDSDGNIVSQERYWHWDRRIDFNRSYEDTVAEFADTFGQIVAEQTSQGRIAIPLSGGLDSRSALAAIPMRGEGDDARREIWAFSYGYGKDSVETTIAGQLATRRALPFTEVKVPQYLFDKVDVMMGAIEGFQDITQTRQACMIDVIRKDADRVLAAHWGDVWLDDMGVRAAATLAWDRKNVADFAFKKLAKPGSAWLLSELCQPQLGKIDANEVVMSSIQKGLSDLEHIEEMDFRIKALKTDSWCWRWTSAGLRMYQTAAFPRLPFYDTRVCDLMCTVPTEFVRGRRLQIDYLKRYAPDLARVKWQPYDASLFAYKLHNNLLLPRRFLKKLSRSFVTRPTIERNWEVQFAGSKGDAGLNRWLTRPGLRIHEFIPRAKIGTLLGKLGQEPTRENGYAVSMLLTFSIWLEKYA